ncbi:MAG: helix-turn-helix domain-containing protein [Muribaculaceae bacterium]|nr:helix-turn-helix domain-containing protein [Muribaculaceae bacterium]
MASELIYNFEITDKISNIISKDFWVMNGFNAFMMPSLKDPIKFTSNVSIFLNKGVIEVDLDLQNLKITSPAVINIKGGQILQINKFSKDSVCSFIVMSKRFTDNLFLLLQDCRLFVSASRKSIINIPDDLVSHFNNFYEHIYFIMNDKDNPYSYQAMVMAISSFFLEIAYRCYEPFRITSEGGNRIVDQFIEMVQQHFKTQRFLNYYAQRLEISPKHLSRTVKKETGFTAVEWIERYVILEAKVLLKSTNKNIQQISDELNFPSQSFFGKYFKKNVGMTPVQFRNN